ncbi:hypothetical protein EVC24_112 [Rhizobium phage RHph_I4]|nr:hypothetical protein EVC24_112 [Rhizobium phage RHph_I4]
MLDCTMTHNPLSPRSQGYWHWEKPGFNDLEIQRLVEEHVALGRSQWPKWSWPTPGPYNGHTGPERVEGWKRVWLAVRIGLLPSPTQCSICLTRNDRIQYHNEDYSRPLQAKPVCQSCHKIVHTRFRSPEGWLQLVARNRVEGYRQWFEDVQMSERNTVDGRHIVQVSTRLATKGMRSRSPTSMRLEVRQRTRKTD